MSTDKQQILDRLREQQSEVKKLRAIRKELKEASGLRCPPQLTKSIKDTNAHIKKLGIMYIDVVIGGEV